MAISDAQFSAWLDTDAEMVVLCEQDFAYESGGSIAIGTIYMADGPYTTGPGDSPPHVRYRSVLKEVPRLKRAIKREQLAGRAEISVTDLRINNVDGQMSFLLEKVIDGYESRFYIGGGGWARSDFRLAFVAVAERVRAPNDDEIVVQLRDKRLLLDRHVVGNQVGGSGPEATQFLPLLYGSCFNVEARLYDAANARYAVLSNYGSGAVVQEVRDSGVSLSKPNVTISAATLTVNPGTEVFTLVGHGLAVNDVVRFREFFGLGVYADFAPFAGMTAGQQYWVATVPSADTFTLSATKGGASINVTGSTYLGAGSFGERIFVRRYYDDLVATGRIELSSSATGRVTVDLKGGSSSSGPFTFMQDLALGWGKITSADVSSAAFTAADTAYAAKIGTAYHNYAVLGRENLLDVLDRLSEAAFGWVGISRAGLLTCGLVDVSGIATAAHSRTLTQDDLAQGGNLSIENAPVGIGRTSILYNRNYTVQTDGIAASVTESNRRLYGNPFAQVQRSTDYSGTAYATNKAFYHRTMVEGEPVALGETSDYLYGLVGVTLTYPTGIADELVADAAPIVQYITAKSRLKFFDVELGDVVLLTYPRYDMESGSNARVIGIELDLTGRAVTLDLVRQISPDLTTSSHH